MATIISINLMFIFMVSVLTCKSLHRMGASDNIHSGKSTFMVELMVNHLIPFVGLSYRKSD